MYSRAAIILISLIIKGIYMAITIRDIEQHYYMIESLKSLTKTNVTTKAYSSKSKAVSLLSEQLVKPVKYKQSILAISNDIDIAIEFGNGSTLKGLNKRIAKNLTTLNISDMTSLKRVVEEVCK